MYKFSIYSMKQRAWDTLKGCYWNALILAFVSNLLAGLVSGIVSRAEYVFELLFQNSNDGVEFETFIMDAIRGRNARIALIALAVFAVAYLVILVVSFLLSTFANEPIAVGQKKAFLEVSSGNMNFDHVIWGFTKNYKNVVKAAAIKWAYILIGGIFFAVPGIIFWYRYMMVPYILAENPDIAPQRALSISRMMMKGNKMKMFIMQLSFIGWYLLGTLACGFGIIFVMPYQLMSETEVYRELRSQAIESGYVLEAELGGIDLMQF